MVKKIEYKKIGKKGVFDSIGDSFRKWAGNFIIVMPYLFNFLAIFLIGGLLLVSILSIFLGTYASTLSITALESMTEEQLIDAFSSILTPGAFMFIFLMVIFLGLILLIIQSFFESGAIGMSIDLANNRKTSLKSMWKNSKKFWLRVTLIKFVLNLLWIILFFILFIPFILIQNEIWFILGIMLSILILFLFIMFAFSEIFCVMDDSNVFDSIKKSWKFVGKKYWSVLGLIIITILISLISGLIPYVSYIFAVLLVGPITTLAKTIYAKSNY